MSGREDLLEQLRRTLAGYSQDQLCTVLEAFGYVFDREGRHGKIYRHPGLATNHPDLEIRRRRAYVQVAKGRELKAGAARDVLDAAETVLAWEEMKDEDTR